MQKSYISRALIVIFILALAIFPVMMFFAPNHVKNSFAQDKQKLAMLQQLELSITPTSSLTPTPTTKVPPPLPSLDGSTHSVTQTPTVSPKPKFIASIVQSQDVSNWTAYKSNNLIHDAFSFDYPSSWKVSYRTSSIEDQAYQFLFTQPNGKQVMNIRFYPKASSVEDFIAANYKDKLTSESFGTFGSYTMYRLQPKDTLPTTDPIYTTFGTRGLVLGKTYAYTISFDDNPSHAMINLIEQVIWPAFTFK